ncbi:hypothetical protein Ade02nite_19320 [Paractinoplanes deccanensis]|uniref:Uncharacterized protein n=1 Tax=Paractinoplanes deccanensis TaxID=113561 RepID=A0ABQ3XZW8_9ACTN|nr:hypothetical protein [Actinoplanes deccanensis]GID73291.1 hypothetical protein Ade02nite_19320 [Actinoplanes deccanensis]
MIPHVVVQVYSDGTPVRGGSLQLCADRAEAVSLTTALNERAVRDHRSSRFRAYRLEPVEEP